MSIVEMDFIKLSLSINCIFYSLPNLIYKKISTRKSVENVLIIDDVIKLLILMLNRSIIQRIDKVWKLV